MASSRGHGYAPLEGPPMTMMMMMGWNPKVRKPRAWVYSPAVDKFRTYGADRQVKIVAVIELV